MEQKILVALNNAQQHSACHQKYIRVLENLYKSSEFENFVKVFMKFVQKVFHQDISVRNPFVERTLEFCSKFVAYMTKPNENDSQILEDEDSASDPFLSYVILETLKYQGLVYVPARYHSCRFITLILEHIERDTHLDNDICDAIQDAMLERVHDPKHSIRLQAVMALVRLQDPLNPDCPVIKAYCGLLSDTTPAVRREVVRRIGPNAHTIQILMERTRDIDYTVRIAAYIRCADIGPKLFKITDRQQILMGGFTERNKPVKQVFTDNLLPKWLNAYNGDFLLLLNALKLDADENDIINTEDISRKLMEIYFRTVPIKDVIDVLPIENNKLIPSNKVTNEVVTYWSILTNYLRKTEEMEEFLDQTIPELTTFCHYIESVISQKTSKQMEDWEYLNYQYILYNLFEMVEQYDLSDEVGRKTLTNLVMSVLQNHRLAFRLLEKVMKIADNLSSNVDTFTKEVCQMISDIREPLIETEASQEENREKEFQLSRLKLKISILEDELETVLENKDYQQASIIQNQLAELKKQIEEPAKSSQPKVRVSKDDPETVCWCLDILTAVLRLKNVGSVTPALKTSREEFLMPLLTSDVAEINWRVLKCLSLYCIIDRGIAEENAKIICIPIATYRAIPNYNKSALIVSVEAISDLLRIYGPALFAPEEENTGNMTVGNNATKRRLFHNEDNMDDMSIIDHSRMSLDFIIEIIVDMLDDENNEIRQVAITALTKLILDEFPVSASLMSRLLLKWYNPLTGKTAEKLQQTIGALLAHYTQKIQGAREVIQKAVIPTLTTIASAPKTSPLADIDIDNVVKLLAALTSSSGTNDIANVHFNLATSICHKIASKPEAIIPYLTKMLVYLDIPADNSAPVKELITQAQLLVDEEDLLEKAPRKNLMKFIEKLKNIDVTQTTANETEETSVRRLAEVNGLEPIREVNEELNENNKENEVETVQNQTKEGESFTSTDKNQEAASNSSGSEQGRPKRKRRKKSLELREKEKQHIAKTDGRITRKSREPQQQQNIHENTGRVTRHSGIPENTNKDVQKENEAGKRIVRYSSINNKRAANSEIVVLLEPVAESTRNNTEISLTVDKSVSNETFDTSAAQVKRRGWRRPRREETQVSKTTDSQADSPADTISEQNDQSGSSKASDTSVALKRKKNRGRGRPRRDETQESKSADSQADSSTDTILHTILEQSEEMGRIEDDSTIETSQSSAKSATSVRRSTRNKTVISETSSESDSNSPSVRRSTRKIKKKNFGRNYAK